MKRYAIILAVVMFVGFLSALSVAQAPVPLINLPLLPDSATPGSLHFILTVNGTGFVPNSVVRWNGEALTTKFVSGSQLTAVVPASKVASAGTASVTVYNPTPGGGTSNVAFFSVNAFHSAGFTLVSTWTVGRSPSSVAVGDFNGDGKLDVATANGDNTISILLGDGTGKFNQASPVSVGPSPVSVAVGDFNGDGRLDLATANAGDNTVSVVLGDGTGKFSLASSSQVGAWLIFVAVGDFNRDGKLDLAVAGDYDSDVSILLGDGTGNFNFASSLATVSNAIAVGDFNADDKLDLGVSDDGENVLIFIGDGTGNFTLDSSAVTGYGPDSLATGDFNGDATLDLAASNYCGEILGYDCNPGTVTMVLGSGSDYCTYLRNYRPTSLVAGDFNSDGNLDLAVANECGYDRWCESGGTVSILLGDGTSDFAVASSPAAGTKPKSLAVGDFNGDGKLDLVVANGTDPGTISVLLWDPRAVTFSSSSLTFGTQRINTSSTSQPVTLTNIGSQTLRITSVVAGTNFSQTNDCGSRLPVGASCTITVKFQPTSTGTLKGSITVADNAANKSQTVSLTGVGTAVGLAPSVLAFGSVAVGSSSQPQAVTLTNYGSNALSIQAIHFTGTDASSFSQTNNCGTSVPAGAACSINVTFTPNSIGKKTGKMIVADDGGGSPQKVSVTGTGK